jgi:hypothetical protein
MSLGTVEAASKINTTAPVIETVDKSRRGRTRRPKRYDNAVRDGYKVAAISGSKQGDVSVKAASKIHNTAPVATQKTSEISLGTIGAASKIDDSPLVAPADESRAKRNDDAVPDAHKVAAISNSKEGEVRVKAASKINNTAPVATLDENQRVRRPGRISLYNRKYLLLICF